MPTITSEQSTYMRRWLSGILIPSLPPLDLSSFVLMNGKPNTNFISSQFLDNLDLFWITIIIGPVNLMYQCTLWFFFSLFMSKIYIVNLWFYCIKMLRFFSHNSDLFFTCSTQDQYYTICGLENWAHFCITYHLTQNHARSKVIGFQTRYIRPSS